MQQKLVKKISNTINDLNTTKELDDFLLGILTPKEIEELNKRLDVIKMLKQGKPQREIAKKLNVGIATVTRGSKELQKGRFKYV
jgi:TrpR family transcriptional regulator, trp operon repressor